MARRSLTAALIVFHVLTIVHVAGPWAQEGWLIDHQPVTSAQPGQPVVIGAELEGTATGVIMYIMVRRAGKKDFSSLSMNLSGEHLFEGQIPAKWVTEEGLDYYLRLQDPIGRMLARYPEDETFIGISVLPPEAEEVSPPVEETAPKPEAEPVGSRAAAIPPPLPVTVPAEVPQKKDVTKTPPQETILEEPAAEPPVETLPQEEVADAPSPGPMAEEPAVPPEKPVIVMEEKKGGLQTWHWLGLGALAVVGIAAVAMSGGGDGSSDKRTPSTELPDPPDHP